MDELRLAEQAAEANLKLLRLSRLSAYAGSSNIAFPCISEERGESQGDPMQLDMVLDLMETQYQATKALSSQVASLEDALGDLRAGFDAVQRTTQESSTQASQAHLACEASGESPDTTQASQSHLNDLSYEVRMLGDVVQDLRTEFKEMQRTWEESCSQKSQAQVKLENRLEGALLSAEASHASRQVEVIKQLEAWENKLSLDMECKLESCAQACESRISENIEWMKGQLETCKQLALAPPMTDDDGQGGRQNELTLDAQSKLKSCEQTFDSHESEIVKLMEGQLETFKHRILQNCRHLVNDVWESNRNDHNCSSVVDLRSNLESCEQAYHEIASRTEELTETCKRLEAREDNNNKRLNVRIHDVESKSERCVQACDSRMSEHTKRMEAVMEEMLESCQQLANQMEGEPERCKQTEACESNLLLDLKSKVESCHQAYYEIAARVEEQLESFKQLEVGENNFRLQLQSKLESCEQACDSRISESSSRMEGHLKRFMQQSQDQQHHFVAAITRCLEQLSKRIGPTSPPGMPQSCTSIPELQSWDSCPSLPEWTSEGPGKWSDPMVPLLSKTSSLVLEAEALSRTCPDRNPSLSVDSGVDSGVASCPKLEQPLLPRPPAELEDAVKTNGLPDTNSSLHKANLPKGGCSEASEATKVKEADAVRTVEEASETSSQATKYVKEPSETSSNVASVEMPIQHRKPIVAIDFDDVLCSYVPSFFKWFMKERPGQPVPLPDTLNDFQNPLRAMYLRSCTAQNPDPIPGAVVGLRRLLAAGMRLWIVTSRPESMQAVTERIVQQHFPGMFSGMHFSAGHRKGALCKFLGASVLIDDAVSHSMDAAKHGINAVLFDLNGGYSWNQAGVSHEKVVRCLSWDSTVDWILNHCYANHIGSIAKARMPVNGRRQPASNTEWTERSQTEVFSELPSTSQSQEMPMVARLTPGPKTKEEEALANQSIKAVVGQPELRGQSPIANQACNQAIVVGQSQSELRSQSPAANHAMKASQSASEIRGQSQLGLSPEKLQAPAVVRSSSVQQTVIPGRLHPQPLKANWFSRLPKTTFT